MYNPRKFLSDLFKSGVQDIVISIPDMKSILEKKVLLLVNVEHTFYIDVSYCLALFLSEGYTLKRINSFEDHSIFFHFFIDKKQDCSWNDLLTQGKKVVRYFLQIEEDYKRFEINEPFYIAPAGYYGQMMYYLLEHVKDKVQGILDNDIQKQGLRLYGTDFLIEHPSKLEGKENVIIVLSESLYSEEIKQGFLKYNPSIQFRYV
jgi:hypothetical protein